MSAGWQVGDLALCINTEGWVDGPTRKPSAGIKAGCVSVVRRVWQQYTFTMLVFDEGHPDGCSAANFRKIRPDEREACEPEFVTLLNRIKRKIGADA